MQVIFQRSENLRAFSSTAVLIECDSDTNSHLQQRALSRQEKYQRAIFERDMVGSVKDLVYSSRTNGSGDLHNTDNVFQIVKLIREEPMQINMRKPLVKILESWDLIDGFSADTR
jgi:hypothetical protein